MKKLLNISLCLILTLNFGYSQSIKRNVISSFGASSNTANSIVETTFGQPPNIGTITDGNNYLRQGFQQPLYNFIMIPGCTDSLANNYNPYATVDDSTCLYSPFVFGCTDSTALNYNPLATVDDSSCCYSSGQLWSQIGQDIDGEAAEDESGFSVSFSSDGNILAIGAIYNDGNGSNAGHVRIYENVGGSWFQIGNDIDGEAAGDRSGWAVSLSSDGNTVAISARYSGANSSAIGHVRIYNYNGTTWNQIGQDIDGEVAGDQSGQSVSLSSDGNTVAIGAHINNGNGSNSGHVRVFQYNGSSWIQIGNDIDGEAAWDQSGHSVSLSSDGNTVAIGARYNNDNGASSGHVRIYNWNGASWNQIGNDIDGEAAYDENGQSVSLSSDGNTVAIGAYGNITIGGTGYVKIYNYNGTSWNQLGNDIDGEAAYDVGGWSVSLSSDGNTVAIGAGQNDGNGSNAGHVRVFTYNGSSWNQIGNDIDGEAAVDHSGHSVSLSDDGNTVAIGALRNDGNGFDAGHVRIYSTSTPCNDLGCLDPLALNFDPNATVSDSTCVYPLYGCIDTAAVNYNASANIDDGSCIYCIYGCTDSLAINYDPLAACDDGSCTYCDIAMTTVLYQNSVPGNIMVGATSSYGPITYLWSNGVTTDYNFSLPIGIYTVTATDAAGCSVSDTFAIGTVIYGCMDSTMANYNAQAMYDDGSCCNHSTGIADTVYKCDSLMTITANSGFTYLWNTGEITQSIVVNSGGYYTLTVSDTSCSLTDTFYVHDYFTSFASGCYTMGFEPNEDMSGWLIEDANNDGYSWNPSSIVGINGGGAMFYDLNYDFVTPADDWLFSQCFTLNAGTNYDLSYFYEVFPDTLHPENLSVYYGTSQSSVSMNTLLASHLGITNTTYDSVGVTFQVPTSAIYYIGWHAHSAADMWRLDLDNISLCESVLGCIDSTANNYDPLATVDDNSCWHMFGCTDPTALNYNPTALMNDGSCLYPINGCTNPIACNYNPAATIDDGSCLTAYGCMDNTAFNYDSLATCSDPLSCIAFVYGCSDTTAYNYYAGANIDDGSCLYVAGCTDATACNYNSLADFDNGSCILPDGCADATACNYDATATCDDGSCEWTSCNTCAEDAPTGLHATNVLQNRATINWDNMNDSVCMVDQYRIKYKAVGASSWIQKNMGQPVGSCLWATQNTDKLILNLIPSTTYEYQMKAWYCGGGNSAWSAIETFTTLDDCPNVGNLTVTTPTTTKATFVWDDSNGPYSFVRIKSRVDTNNAVWFNVGGVGVPYGIFTKDKNNLSPGTSYRAQARTWCDPNGGAYKSPTWTSLVNWTMPTIIRLEGGTTIADLEVYPNPSRDVFNVIFTSEVIQDLKVRILNIIGEELVNDDLQQFIGEYTKQIDLSNNAKGIYFLEIETEDGIINKKLILQ